ncbi:MAG TPA: peroxidase [Hellea balneolensis]|uniref:Peroxidase n=1 Tax=Hellea balneolensis TaxID=287478 RepID=A0A7C3CA20_9PROT|nr:peroxidase [Hellea balneolensis]
MSLFPNLPKNPHLGAVFQAFPEQVRPLLEYHDLLLRAPGPLTIAQRELIATYVSGLNACTFCFGAHKIYAKVFGVEESLIDAMMDDLDTAPLDEKMKPLLSYVKKLNNLPTQLREADAKAVYDAGWSERALYDAVQICALFNFMNRIIEGTGVTFDYAAEPPSDADIEARKTRSYMDYGRELGIVDD